jgi:hypothetical protein
MPDVTDEANHNSKPQSERLDGTLMTVSERYVETPYSFMWWPILIVCPRCTKAAVATQGGRGQVRISCASCAFAREGRMSGLGDGLLLLEEGHESHLDFLAGYISADLRERSPGHKSETIGWRLPTWMKDAKHRREVVMHLNRMRGTLPR